VAKGRMQGPGKESSGRVAAKRTAEGAAERARRWEGAARWITRDLGDRLGFEAGRTSEGANRRGRRRGGLNEVMKTEGYSYSNRGTTRQWILGGMESRVQRTVSP
jgi:hypothetical protein